jgi:uncharacterized protein (DUF952 family)
MAVIYHVTSRSSLEEGRTSGQYVHASLTSEGFIHCSQKEQVDAVLERYFVGQTELVILSIDTDKLQSPVVYEWSPSTGDTFPHVYGPINMNAIIDEKAV